jgi:hypothetical protein
MPSKKSSIKDFVPTPAPAGEDDEAEELDA